MLSTEHLCRVIPPGLSVPVELWLLGAWLAPPPVGARWRLAQGLACHADPNTMTVATDEMAYRDRLRTACGLGWYYPALTASCGLLADHGYLRRLGAVSWQLTYPPNSEHL